MTGDAAGPAVVVFATAPDAETAERLARALLDAHLAACVTRVPGAVSLYHWQGKVEESSEIHLMIKTHSRRAPALTRMLCELHPYEVPEILVLPVTGGLGSYLDWVHEVTEAADDES